MKRLVFLILVLSLVSCAVNPVSGDRQLALVSEGQEIQIGREVASNAQKQFGLVDDKPLQSYVRALGQKLAQASERPDLPWSFQADDLGYRYALEQGYDVREMVNVFAALQQSAQLAGQSPVPSWQASHPHPDERIRRINRELASLPATSMDRRVGEAEYLERITGLAYGENPRHGYFDDHRFLHPDLAFRIDFPQGWRSQNLSNAVVAGSPKEDAILQLRQPLQVTVVRLPREMSLKAFNDAYPSAISLPELGLINQLERPEEVMPRSFLAKQVIEARL